MTTAPLATTPLAATPAAATHRPGPDPDAHHPVLVTPQWLQDHLDDPAVQPVEIDVSPRAHTEWHIPGATLWDAYTDLKDADYRPVPARDVELLLARSGIGPRTTVVCYGYAPALGFWLLKCHGHADVRILDCSRDTWRHENRPTSTEPAPPRTARQPLPEPDTRPDVGPDTVPGTAPRADRVTVQAAIGDPATTILDVRSAAEYRGERFWPSGGMDPNGRAGHIPTAVHKPLDGVLDDRGAFRPTNDLCRVLAPADGDGRHDLITYCTIGARAATAWFVLTYLLGHDRVRVYDGSWAEWGRLPDTPVG